MKYMPGISADMDDLLKKTGQKQAEDYFDALIFNIENNIYKPPRGSGAIKNNTTYEAVLPERPKIDGHNVVIVTNYAETDNNLQNMIADFRNTLPYPSAVVNLRKFPFSGGCLGCFSCATSAKCVHKDGFDDFLRQEILAADALVYAFSIENHYTHSSFKLYDDRQFCNGHRMLTKDMPIGYIISGDYRGEANLQTIVEARSEVGGCYLSGIATDEEDTVMAITNLSKSLTYALEHSPSRPQNFYGVGGTKIFRDLIYLMQGLMKADHKFYKRHKIYDFPQKQRLKILKMQLVGFLMSIPAMQKGMKGKMNKVIVAPYKKVIAAAVPIVKN
jgi:multimeric flavodoxin WrbA